MVVLVPSDATETAAAIKAAAEHQGPVYIRTGRMAVEDIHPDGVDFQIGRGEVLRRGEDLAIIATGICVKMALEAAETLAKDGIQARVINMSTIKPIDKDLIIEAAKECKKIVTVEEHNVIGGLGSAVAEVLVENYPVKMKRVGVQDEFGQSGKPNDLLEAYKLTSEAIVEASKNL